MARVSCWHASGLLILLTMQALCCQQSVSCQHLDMSNPNPHTTSSFGTVSVAQILLLNGPNLNLLGTREPRTYGGRTLADIVAVAFAQAHSAGHDLDHLQSNSELALIERLHAAKSDATAFIVINPGAFTHTSVALRDALAAVAIPFIEVHLSNVHAREVFRHRSLFSDLAVGVICGLGADGYEFALAAALRRLDKAHEQLKFA